MCMFVHDVNIYNNNQKYFINIFTYLYTHTGIYVCVWLCLCECECMYVNVCLFV